MSEMPQNNSQEIIITIHQPEHLIWLGLLDKISKADKFVILDTVDFCKNYFQNRNKIRTDNSEGWTWITVPVQAHNHVAIKDIKICNSSAWQRKYLHSVQFHYSKSLYFDKYYEDISYTILKNYSYLRDLNYHLIRLIMKWFEINTEVELASDLNLNPDLKSTDLLLDICKKLEATTYLSGPSGKSYLEIDKFENIKVIFHEFKHPVYKQQYKPFIPGMSSLDFLFNNGGTNLCG